MNEIYKIKRLIATILVIAITACCTGCESEDNGDAGSSLGLALLLAAVAGGVAVMSYEEEYPVSSLARDLAIERCIEGDVMKYIDSSGIEFYDSE